MKTPILCAALLLAPATPALAQQADTTARLTFGAFVDTYYAYDFGRPASHDRAFTTQAQRHDEFAVNLAHVEANYASPKVHARLALQAGTSVQANYAAEPDSIAGTRNFLPLLQEAYAGVSVSPTLWVDAGIFFSHIGSEGWISIDLPNYTRSLPAEFSPYYETGVRVRWQATPALTAHLHVGNGWQNISETNHDKAVGVRLDWAPNTLVALSYSNFVGREARALDGAQDVRVFHDFSARVTPDPRLLVIPTVDFGTQGGDSWWTGSLVGRYAVTPAVAVNGRVERFDDHDAVLTLTPAGSGLRTNAASLGIDLSRGPAMWRTEVKTFFGSKEEVFPDRDAASGFAKTSTAVVTSLAVRF